MAKTLRKEFEESHQTYGVPRLQQVLRKQGKWHGKARIKHPMQQEGLNPKAAKRFKVTTDSRHSKPVAEKVLGRQFNPAATNIAWPSYITYIHTQALLKKNGFTCSMSGSVNCTITLSWKTSIIL